MDRCCLCVVRLLGGATVIPITAHVNLCALYAVLEERVAECVAAADAAGDQQMCVATDRLLVEPTFQRAVSVRGFLLVFGASMDAVEPRLEARERSRGLDVVDDHTGAGGRMEVE